MRQKRTISIKQKLIVLSVLLLLIPATLIGVVAYTQAKQKIESQMIQSANSGVDRMNNEVTNLIAPIQTDISFFSNRIDASIYEEGEDNQALAEKFTEYLDTHPKVTNIFFASAEGTMTIYPEQELPEGYDPRTRPWYEAAEASGQDVAITNPYVDAASQKMMITVSKKTADGRGVVAVDVDVNDIAEVAKNIQIGEEGYVAIFDEARQVVIHPSIAVGEKSEESSMESVFATDEGILSAEENGEGAEKAFVT
ncbi:PDC sensor domain-containing protein, partial [Exiguobacterium sp. B2(2022)]|uniref:PDC sensor domain-containing protein n=1 Tax=Exiguobacterium sp. B2(2022) TaxID=2992755 RepID=UPI00237A8CE6